MRLIDADQLISDIQSHNDMEENNPTWRSKDVVMLLENAPEPPNDPLTLEELREMDGEPVYVIFTDGHQGWAILDIWAKSNDSCVTLYGPDMESYEEQRLDFLNTNGEGQAGYDGWKAYRRKPEEGT